MSRVVEDSPTPAPELRVTPGVLSPMPGLSGAAPPAAGMTTLVRVAPDPLPVGAALGLSPRLDSVEAAAGAPRLVVVVVEMVGRSPPTTVAAPGIPARMAGLLGKVSLGTSGPGVTGVAGATGVVAVVVPLLVVVVFVTFEPFSGSLKAVADNAAVTAVVTKS